jgi:CysZ protein
VTAAGPEAAGSLLAGLRLPLEAWRLLRRERSLWRLAAAPLALTGASVVAALGAIVAWAPELHELASGWLPIPEAATWYAWLWVGPLRVLLALLGLLLFAGLAGALLVAAFALANLLASPFLDALSRRVERLVAGEVPEAGGAGLRALVREGGRAVAEEARRTAFFVGVELALLAAGLLLPGGQLVAAPAMTLFAIGFLPLEYASYCLDRRRVPFREKRRWVLARAPLMLGYGSAAFLTCLVPGLNLLALPVLVVGGTLLALRYAPPPGGSTRSGPSRAAIRSRTSPASAAPS